MSEWVKKPAPTGGPTLQLAPAFASGWRRREVAALRNPFGGFWQHHGGGVSGPAAIAFTRGWR